jgi:hypothetical protein
MINVRSTKLEKSFNKWDVPAEWQEIMSNYLKRGWHPGSFFEAVLCNDFIRAIRSSHPLNTVDAMKALVGWISEYMPRGTYGSNDAIEYWCSLTDDQRRDVLERAKLLETPWELLQQR